MLCELHLDACRSEYRKKRGEETDPPFTRISSYVRETQLIHLALLFIVPCDRSKYVDEKLLFIPPQVLYTVFFIMTGPLLIIDD